MKGFLLLFLFISLSSCFFQKEGILPSERIIRFTRGDSVIGYGVRVGESDIMTVTHVFDACKKGKCQTLGSDIGKFHTLSRGEVTLLGTDNISDNNSREKVNIGDRVYILRSQGGYIQRFDTTVSAIDVSYLGYDETLSGSLSTGAIEIDMPLEKGESGLPVWNLSGELLGVVSATNKEQGKSYVVR